MRILVMGAGAVGGAHGAMLQQAGHEVIFVARGAHLAALQEKGLTFERPRATVVLSPVQAVERPVDVRGEVDLVLFTVKGYSTADAIEALRPVVRPTTTVLTMQNGVDSPEQLAAAFGAERVLAGTTTINAAVPAPGVVQERGVPIRSVIAELSGEITSRLEAVADVLRGAGVEMTVSTDAQAALWQKFVLLAPHATLTSATGESVGAIREVPEGFALYRQLIDETVAIARAAGVALPDDIAASTLEFVRTMPPVARSSMAIDFERRRPVELEQLTGAIVRRSRALGVPAPGFNALYPVLKVRALAYGGLDARPPAA